MHIIPFFRIRYGGPNAYGWLWLNDYTAAADKFYGWLQLMKFTAAAWGSIIASLKKVTRLIFLFLILLSTFWSTNYSTVIVVSGTCA